MNENGRFLHSVYPVSQSQQGYSVILKSVGVNKTIKFDIFSKKLNACVGLQCIILACAFRRQRPKKSLGAKEKCVCF